LKESNIGVAREQYFAFNEVTSWLNLVAHEHGEDGQCVFMESAEQLITIQYFLQALL
jgi:hypothetical protein